VKTYSEDLDIGFPEKNVHFHEYMSEPEFDMRITGLSQKGEKKGPLLGLH